jgi:hypothetical protein
MGLVWCLLGLAVAAPPAALSESILVSAEPGCLVVARFDIAPGGKSAAYAGLIQAGTDTAFGVWEDRALLATGDEVPVLEYTAAGRLWFGIRQAGQVGLVLGTGAPNWCERIVWRSVASSRDGCRIAWAARRNGRWQVLNAELPERHSSATPDTLRLSGKGYDRVGLPEFGSDGRTVLYPAARAGPDGTERWCVVAGTQEGRWFDCDWLGWVRQNAGATRLAACLVRNERARLVENEREGAVYDDMGWLTYAPNGNELVCAAKSRGRWSLVRSGYRLRESFDGISYPTFSPDGTKLIYVARGRGQEFVVGSLHRGPGFDEVILPGYSPDSRRLGYIARADRKWRVVVDDRPGPLYDEVSWLTWSRDGANWACRARTGERYCVVVNGREGKVYDGICRIEFSPDGRRVNYGARQGRRLLWCSSAVE